MLMSNSICNLKVWLVAETLETVILGVILSNRCLTTLKDFPIFVDLVDLDALFNEFVVFHIKIINANGIQEGTHRQATLGIA